MNRQYAHENGILEWEETKQKKQNKKAMKEQQEHVKQKQHEHQKEQCKTQKHAKSARLFHMPGDTTYAVVVVMCCWGKGVYSSHESSVFYVPSQTPAEREEESHQASMVHLKKPNKKTRRAKNIHPWLCKHANYAIPKNELPRQKLQSSSSSVFWSKKGTG